jgi:hypothetical protein
MALMSTREFIDAMPEEAKSMLRYTWDDHPVTRSWCALFEDADNSKLDAMSERPESEWAAYAAGYARGAGQPGRESALFSAYIIMTGQYPHKAVN